ncbi:MAG: CocE/NonD family hydrolase [Alphaproteobacteria bacterium]|nr:CocE/NonD family hydrolase [Alphaproteobacteria bacterium]
MNEAPALETLIESDVMVAMRDGVRLATDVYRPARGGKALTGTFPVILERTPYNKAATSRSERTADSPEPASRADIARFFVAQGYVVVYQDCRGRYGSEGQFVKYLSDAADGQDCMKWIMAQPWCNGKVGTMGLSYGAHTQGALGCLDPPGLAAQVIDSGAFSSAYHAGIRQGGAFELKQATWAYGQALAQAEATGDALTRHALTRHSIHDWFARMPWRPGASAVTPVPDYESYLFEQWTHGNFGPYWQQLGIYMAGFYERYADVPVILMSSWYDAYVRTATENYLGLKTHKTSPIKLVMGPWTHGDRSVTFSGDVDFGPDATLDGALAPDFRHFRLRWFDRWLRGIDNGAERDAPVRIFVMGGGSGRKIEHGRLDHGGTWRDESDWPLPGTRFTPYYLHADGNLSPAAPVVDGAGLAYRFDPRDPVPSIGGTMTSGQPIMEGGAYDQVEGARFFGCKPPHLPLAARPDVLVFQTPPLAEPVEVTGPITVKLWISSDCPDTDFTAKLIDVYPPSKDWPNGYAMNITDGIIRARYRDSWEQPDMMEPGRIYTVAIEPFASSNLFARGHRIRLDISSSNFPHFDVNPNTGEPEGRARLWRVATNTVRLDRTHPSHVVLPIISTRR